MSKAVQAYCDSYDILKSCGIYITADCNINCKICYMTDKKLPKNKVISKELIDKTFLLMGNNSYSISILGGEPFLYPEICKYICNKAKENNSFVRFTTNGFWGKDLELTNFIINEIKPNIIEFSIDEYHQEFISIETVHSAINNLHKTNIDIFINSCFDFEKSTEKEQILKIKKEFNFPDKPIYIFSAAVKKIGNARINNLGKLTNYCNLGICTCCGFVVYFDGTFRVKCSEDDTINICNECKKWTKNLLEEEININEYNNFFLKKRRPKQLMTIDSILRGNN